MRTPRFLALLVLFVGGPPAVIAPRVSPDAVVEAYRDGVSAKEIADILSVTLRRVQQILAAEGALPQRLPTHPRLADLIRYEAMRHGPNYGFRMLTGALRARHPGYTFPQRAVVAALRAAAPRAFRDRRSWATKKLDRGVYRADHFMYSVHLDLACKLQEYGLYVAALIDGDSRMALGLTALTRKTRARVYAEAFEPCVAEHGLPDQLITDKGWEVRVRTRDHVHTLCAKPLLSWLCVC